MRYGLEVIAVPVTVIDRAKAFYEQLGWRLDIDTSPAPDIRILQFTPPESDASILIGGSFPMSEPRSLRGAVAARASIGFAPSAGSRASGGIQKSGRRTAATDRRQLPSSKCP